MSFLDSGFTESLCCILGLHAAWWEEERARCRRWNNEIGDLTAKFSWSLNVVWIDREGLKSSASAIHQLMNWDGGNEWWDYLWGAVLTDWSWSIDNSYSWFFRVRKIVKLNSGIILRSRFNVVLDAAWSMLIAVGMWSNSLTALWFGEVWLDCDFQHQQIPRMHRLFWNASFFESWGFQMETRAGRALGALGTAESDDSRSSGSSWSRFLAWSEWENA